MQGLFIGAERPKSKKAIRELLTGNPTGEGIRVEATSVFGNEFRGPLPLAPVGTKIDFVGPDPYTSRKFYGRLAVTDKGVKLS